MAGMIFDLEIEYEDRADVDQVRADQRDMAAFEQKYRIGTTRALETMTVQFLRFIGWRALRRTGRVDIGFDEWDKIVTSVSEPADDDADQDDGDQDGDQGDPTNPDR